MSSRWRSAPAEARPALVLAVVAAAAAAVLSSGMVAAVREGRALDSAVEAELASVAELHASRVAQWRREREQDLQLALEAPGLAAVAEALARGDRVPAAEAAQAGALWGSVARQFLYADVQLLDLAGRTLLSVTGRSPVRGVAGDVDEARRTRSPAWSQLRGDASDSCFVLVGPVLDARGKTVAGLALVIDPRQALYPFLASWPRPSRSGESLLVERHGGEALIVSPRRSPDLPTVLPLELTERPAVQAALGRTGPFRGVDRGGAPVRAALRPVPHTPWVVVAKVDEDEAREPARSRFRVALLLGTAAVVLATGLAATIWWRHALRGIREARAEQERLRVAMARHQELVAGHPDDVVLLLSADGRILEANRRAVETYGWTRDELLEMAIRDLRAPEASAPDPSDAPSAVPLLLETVHRRRDGSTLPVEVRSRNFVAGGVEYRQNLVRDLSAERAADVERSQRQEQLFVSQRMASLGTLAAGIAHEINNPLSFVISNLAFAAGELEAGAAADLGEVRAALADAAEGGRRVQEVVRDLGTFAGAETKADTTDDLAAVLRSVLSVARNEIKYRARLAVELPSLPPVWGSPHRLGQVFLHLLINAAQALPAGEADRHEIAVRAVAREDRVWVEVADDGPGIPPDLRQRIFDPFFTTKPLGVGTGLGLSTCHGIVTAAGGTLSLVASERGAVFRVELLRADAAPAVSAAADQAISAPAAARR